MALYYVIMPKYGPSITPGENLKTFINSELEAKRLGANIYLARKRRNMTLIELSTKSSVSKTVLRRIEAGDTSVGCGKIFNVLDALGLLAGLADLASPELDREQTLNEIKALREGKHKHGENNSKNRLVRFI